MHENLLRIKAVHQALKGLEQDYVFVGGATVSLYATNAELAAEIRPTDDVDIVVELASYKGYAELDDRLRNLGFNNDIVSGVICRYTVQGIIVDIMPTDPSIIGFSNRWYAEGFESAIQYALDEQTTVQIFRYPILSPRNGKLLKVAAKRIIVPVRILKIWCMFSKMWMTLKNRCKEALSM